MAKSNERRIPKLKNQPNRPRRELDLATLYPDTECGLNAVMFLNRATQYGAQKLALLPDTPNLSPNEIDYLKALLGF